VANVPSVGEEEEEEEEGEKGKEDYTVSYFSFQACQIGVFAQNVPSKYDAKGRAFLVSLFCV
jgi:hypothetical protein